MASYKLIAPGFPRFVPVSHTKPSGRWREWGKPAIPSIVSVGLPRATQAERHNALAGTMDHNASDHNSASYPRREIPPELSGDN